MKKGKRLLCGALALLLVLSLTAVATVQRAYATKSEEDQAAEEQKKAEEAAQRQAEMDELERKKQESPVTSPIEDPAAQDASSGESEQGRPELDDSERSSDPLKAQTGKQPKPSNPEGSL